ncbi:hypothetical protein PP298_08140 [Mycobacteroides abscessus]|uniref:hypothetical protein n=1 Tax=Mycobacteroides abscessus TaxID=36809 RepID=UPI00078BB1AA|nr:hypothetical protein [Mycobacteroides abscessus]AMU71466.1 hypothetical protein A3O05_16515 [Mycobacteroides abscessus]MDM2015311.1 hypothetical protein [Mycobacteroides abscessus]MDM2019689.1 hypothetical protein [Mycobacteroides abscessus]MDM2025102.1 hypothetical protein [Mycobacteroides abscessus]MDM2027773.1 hypothetical protein [Mycobacteroides abscessus]
MTWETVATVLLILLLASSAQGWRAEAKELNVENRRLRKENALLTKHPVVFDDELPWGGA